jgi:hypothetical protein
MPSLSEMRANKGTPPPRPRSTHTVTLIEGQHLLDQIGRLDAEKTAVLMNALRNIGEDGEKDGPPRKSAEPSTPPRVTEINAEMATLEAQLGEHQAELTLVGIDGGAWQRFKTEHPARTIGHQETTRKDGDVVRGAPIIDGTDLRLTYGLCDAEALFNALGLFVGEWEGEPIAPGEWDEWLAERITYADRRDLVTAVVALHEDRVNRVPKSPSGSSATEPGESD